MSQNRPKVLFDLCDLLDHHDQFTVKNIPLAALQQNPHTGRIILDDDDPLVTKLCLLGLKPLRLQWLPGSK